MILELKNISAGYDRTPIIQGVNLQVNEDDFIGVIGPNGGGKTTLLKTILGLIKPMKGTITFGKKMSEGGTHKIGYLPQVNAIDKKFPISVFDVVRTGAMSRKSLWGSYPKEVDVRSNELLEEMGIAHLKDYSIGELSGGQMQRVFLCRALVNDPRLLILDEPNTYVDNQFEKELYEKLKVLNHRMAIVLVSHDIGTVSSSVKSIACVNRGLHYHNSNQITEEQIKAYNCPIQLISHGDIPHTVLKKHK